MDPDLKNILFSFFKDVNIDKQTSQKKIIEIYEAFNRTMDYLINQHIIN